MKNGLLQLSGLAIVFGLFVCRGNDSSLAQNDNIKSANIENPTMTYVGNGRTESNTPYADYQMSADTCTHVRYFRDDRPTKTFANPACK